MTSTGHAVLGVAIAAAIPDPLIGIPLAVLSHVAADAFPHWDTGTNMLKKSRQEFVIGSVIDLTISFILAYLLIQFLFPGLNLVYVFVMVIAAQGLDWATGPYLFLKWKFPPFSYFYALQKSFDHRLDKPWGIIGQIGILLFFLFIAHSLYLA